jgi:hypothetical protein
MERVVAQTLPLVREVFGTASKVLVTTSLQAFVVALVARTLKSRFGKEPALP